MERHPIIILRVRMQQKYPYFNSLLLLFRYITTTTITMISITIFFILSTVLPSATVKYNYYFNVVLYITTIKIHYYYYCSCTDSLDSSRMKRPYTLLQELKKTAPLIQPRQKRVMLEYNLLFIIILFLFIPRPFLLLLIHLIFHSTSIIIYYYY